MKYTEYLIKLNLSKNTIQVYEAQAIRFEKYVGKTKLNAQVVKIYIAGWNGKYKPTTVNLYIIALNKYLKWMGYSELIQQTKRIQRNRSLMNVLSIQEYHQLLQYAKKTKRYKYFLIMRLLAGTGIRIGELEYVTVIAIVKGSCIVFNKGKYHEIYIPYKLQEELLEYCREEQISKGPIFLGNRQTPVSRSGVWKMLKTLAEKVGVPEEKVHPHSFRHLFAKSYMKQYGDISELADILGHSSIEMTRIYTVTTVEEKRSRLNSLQM